MLATATRIIFHIHICIRFRIRILGPFHVPVEATLVRLSHNLDVCCLLFLPLSPSFSSVLLLFVIVFPSLKRKLCFVNKFRPNRMGLLKYIEGEWINYRSLYCFLFARHITMHFFQDATLFLLGYTYLIIYLNRLHKTFEYSLSIPFFY